MYRAHYFESDYCSVGWFLLFSDSENDKKSVRNETEMLVYKHLKKLQLYSNLPLENYFRNYLHCQH